MVDTPSAHPFPGQAPAAHHEGLHQNRQSAQSRLALRALHPQDVRDHGLAFHGEKIYSTGDGASYKIYIDL